MKDYPLVSVIMPVYNGERYVGQAIESVIDQYYSSWELFVIDDGSTDRTVKIVEKYLCDSRVSLVGTASNSGVAKARNLGLKRCNGEYIAFLDSDDYWVPHKLLEQVRYMVRGWDLVFSSYYRVNKDGQILSSTDVSGDYQLKDVLRGNPIGNLTGIYNRSKLGLFYQENIGHEDYAMWLEIIDRAGRGLGLEDRLAYYRVVENSKSSNKLKSAIWTFKILKRYSHGALDLFINFYHYVINGINKNR